MRFVPSLVVVSLLSFASVARAGGLPQDTSDTGKPKDTADTADTAKPWDTSDTAGTWDTAPEDTARGISASDLAAEKGGCNCGSVGSAGLGLAPLLLAMGLMRRGRRA